MAEASDSPDMPESGDKGASDTLKQTQQTADPKQGSPSLSGEDQNAGQTQTPAAEDDVGVPDDAAEEK